MGFVLEQRKDGFYLEDIKLHPNSEEASRYFAEGYWKNHTIGDYADRAAAKWPERTALVFKEQRISFYHLKKIVDRLALHFLDLGIKKGDVVSVQLPNCPEHVYAILALAKIGAIFNPIGTMMRAREVKHMLDSCESIAIVIPYEFGKFNYYEMIKELKPELPHLQDIYVVGGEAPAGTISLNELLKNRSEEKYPPDYLNQYRPEPNDISLIGFTSGTTALPKAYIHTHNTELANVTGCAIADGFPFLGEKPLVNLTFFGYNWMAGRWCSFLADLMYGVTTVMLDIFDPEEALKLIEQERPDSIHAAPVIYKLIMDAVEQKQANLSSLKIALYGGSVCPWELARLIKSKVPYLMTVYGMSEVSPICELTITDAEKFQITSSGRPGLGNLVKVVDPNGKRLMAKEEGEILVKGPGVCLGYLRQPEITELAFDEEGFFHSGDVGYWEENGYFFVTGRTKDVISRGGIKFSAREVEELLFNHPKIKDVAIIGIPDPKLGERSCACIVPEPGTSLTLEEITNYLREKQIATFKLPERLEIFEILPYTPTGKIQKYVLKDLVTKKNSSVIQLQS